MRQNEEKYGPLVQKVLTILQAEYENLDPMERSLSVIAAVEAIACIAAQETASHTVKTGVSSKEAENRFLDYTSVFTVAGKEEIEKAADRLHIASRGLTAKARSQGNNTKSACKGARREAVFASWRGRLGSDQHIADMFGVSTSWLIENFGSRKTAQARSRAPADFLREVQNN